MNRLDDESGFTLIELMAALTILSVAFFALAMGASTGLKLVSQARQREAASEIANGHLEHIKNIPYDKVALESSLTHSTDTTDPDYYVSTDGSRYDHTGAGAYEDLEVDTDTGEVPHIEDPVVVGTTTLRVNQYVTWVDDPNITGTHDYKRVTVVVSYETAIPVGRPRYVRTSALFTSDGVVISGSTSGASQGIAASPSPTPTPSPTPSSGPCSGDNTGPSGDFTILSGTGATTGYTASTNVQLSLAPSDACTPIKVQLSNDSSTYGALLTYDSFNPTTTWTLVGGDGSKNVWAKFYDGNNNVSTKGPHTVVLDQTKPTVPGTLSRTVSCVSSNRTVSLSWGASTDANFQGYRVYRSVNGAAYVALTTTSTSPIQDTTKKSLDSVSYKVVAYDKAGNESNPTNVISLSKNQCA